MTFVFCTTCQMKRKSACINWVQTWNKYNTTNEKETKRCWAASLQTKSHETGSAAFILIVSPPKKR